MSLITNKNSSQKFPEPCTIQPAQESDVDLICELAGATFGSFASVRDVFLKWILEERFYVIVAKTQSGALSGLAAVHIPEAPMTEKFSTFGPKVLEFLKGRKTAHVLNLAVHPKFRRQGLGRELSRHMVLWLRDKLCEAVVGNSWDNGRADNSRCLFEMFGFEKCGENADFLNLQSRENQQTCSVCGGECQCNAIFFGLSLKNLSIF
jgi:ribosomal protein S18 acetylase RimI-like enzyme